MSSEVRSIEVRGFASLRAAQVELGDLNVLVGANGSGKSNFVRALELLGRIVDGGVQLFFGVNGFEALASAGGKNEITLTLLSPPYGYEAVMIPARDDQAIFNSERLLEAGEWRRLNGPGQRESILSRERGWDDGEWGDPSDGVARTQSLLAG